MNLGERIKKIRKEFDLTQAEFAARIGSVQNTVTGYESGRRNPSTPVIALICREFNIREEWLRTGEGEMLKPSPTDTLDQLAQKYNLSNSDYVMIEKFINLRPEVRNNIFDFFHEVVAAIATDDTDPYASSFSRKNVPNFSMDKVVQNYHQHQSVEEAEAAYIKSRSNFAQKMDSSALSTTADENKADKHNIASNQ